MDQSVLMASLGPRPAGDLEPAMAGAEGYTDAEVMLRVKAGDQSAFDFLVQKYRRPLVSFMYRMARNTAAAEDLAQEVFLRVYRSRQTYEASAKFTTWLYRIATNLAVNHARDTRKERPEVTVSLDEQDDDTGTTMDVADGRMSAEEALVRRERMLAIRSKVEGLPERQRLAVIMHKYLGQALRRHQQRHAGRCRELVRQAATRPVADCAGARHRLSVLVHEGLLCRQDAPMGRQ